MLRVDSLDTINRRLEGQGQITFLRSIDWRLSLREFCLKLDARELVNGVPQLCRIIFDGANDARKNYGKVNLGRFCRKVFPAHNFLRFRDHVKTRSSGSPQKPRPRRCQRRSQYSILMDLFIASSPIERRHTRQRIAEKPSRQVVRLEFGSAITIRQRQWTRPNARREY